VALEALVALPPSFAGGVIYEPALVIGPPHDRHLSGDALPRDGQLGEGLRHARAALLDGKRGKAIGIATAVIAGWPGWVADIGGRLTALVPEYRRLIPCQIDDLEAMERLGPRLDAYSKIGVPTVLLHGDRTPASNREMVAAVSRVMPSANNLVLHAQGHTAHVRAPGQVAAVIQNLGDKVLRQQ
jgi:pimeloyl-ACP methyl ester carboxylesterase